MNIDFNSVLNTLASKAKALALNITEIELKVLEATNEEPWGPHGKDMQEIARAAEDPEKYNLIMNTISERLQMRDENWRLCYKALLLVEYMVKHGPWRIVDELSRSVSSLERLRDDFEYKDAQGRDHGINVRQRAGELASLVCNTDRVRQEREKASRNANKFKGIGSSDVQGGSGTFGSSSSGADYGYGGFGGGFGGGKSGGSRSQGFGSGSTESVHMPSSLSIRASSGSQFSRANGFGSVTTMETSSRREESFRVQGSSGGEEAEDPFEATRKRIERLKAEGALQESTPSGLPPGLADPTIAGGKGPKKLSDVKINPAVAATFANISVPASSSTANLTKLAPPPPPAAHLKTVSTTDTLDLIRPSDSQAVSQQQQSSVAASGLDWDTAFSTAQTSGSSSTAVSVAATAATASEDPFTDFCAPAPAAPAAATASSEGFNAFLSSGVSNSSASVSAAISSKPPVRPPLSFDDFAELCPPPAPSPLPFGLSAGALPSPPPAVDAFAALASSSSLSAPTLAMLAPRVPPTPTPALDPFAALSSLPKASAPPPVRQPPKPAEAPLIFDAFGRSLQQTARIAQSAAVPAAVAVDPFAALASSSASARVHITAAARPPLQPSAAVVAAAVPFDPFAPPAPPEKPSNAAPPFDAFGSVIPIPQQPVPAMTAMSTFNEFFGAPTASGQNGPISAGPRTSIAADAFAASAFPVFPPLPLPPVTSTATPLTGPSIAMNKTGAAVGANVHKNHDPFAGLGF